jgi:hypothetical protein
MTHIVITTIQKDTETLSVLRKMENVKLIMVGDLKTPNCNDIISIEQQKQLPLKSVGTTPFNHYCRKNIGYIKAIKDGAKVIYDTDDDNIPIGELSLCSFNDASVAFEDSSGDKFLNIYKFYSAGSHIWPRGFPLNRITNQFNYKKLSGRFPVGVWQGMVNGDADVDSIYRLVSISPANSFHNPNDFIVVNKNCYCPFNSQCTTWRQECFPLMYLPVTVTFRFTDILRGYIAQKIMWHHGYYLGFHNPIVFQKRNPHNFIKDFEDEIPMFLQTEKVVDRLDNIALTNSMTDNLFITYRELESAGIVKKGELENVKNWIDDIGGA